MPPISNKQPNEPSKAKKIGRSIRWQHVAAGFLIYAIIAAGLIWHATSSNQPVSRAAAAYSAPFTAFSASTAGTSTTTAAVTLSWNVENPYNGGYSCTGSSVAIASLYYNVGTSVNQEDTPSAYPAPFCPSGSSTVNNLSCNTAYAFELFIEYDPPGGSGVAKGYDATDSLTTAACQAAPPPAPTPTPSPAPAPVSSPPKSSSTHSSSSAASKSVGSAAAANAGSTASLLPQGNQTTNTPPNTPTGFTASTGPNSAIVNLSWNAPSAGSAVNTYEIDRSISNGASWQTLSDAVQNTFFSDLTANFDTSYLYRLVAKNASGSSGYVYVSTTTAGFKANAGPSQSVTLQSSDGVATVFIPTGALTQPAACGLAINPILSGPSVKGYIPVAGPYSVTCKTQNGAIIQSYAKAFSVTLNTSAAAFAKFKNLAYYGQQTVSQHWDAVAGSTNAGNHTVSFELANSYSFIAMGQQSHAPWWASVLIVILILLFVAALVVITLRTLAKRRQQEAYDVNYRKEWGL